MLGAAAVALAAVLIVLFAPTGDAPPPAPSPSLPPSSLAPGGGQAPSGLASLARVEPLPVRLEGGQGVPGSFEDSRLRALGHYQAARYDSASAYFHAALQSRPSDSQTFLYLGSAELLRGDATSAIAPLQAAAARAGDPALRTEALWQLLNAQLRAEQGAAALRTARRLEALGGRHAPETGALIARIEGAISAP